MKVTCSSVFCDGDFRIRWFTHCPTGRKLEDVIGKCPWETLEGREAERFQAVLARVASRKEMEQHDFTVPGHGPFRAWIFFTPLRETRLLLLVRQIPAVVML